MVIALQEELEWRLAKRTLKSSTHPPASCTSGACSLMAFGEQTPAKTTGIAEAAGASGGETRERDVGVPKTWRSRQRSDTLGLRRLNGTQRQTAAYGGGGLTLGQRVCAGGGFRGLLWRCLHYAYRSATVQTFYLPPPVSLRPRTGLPSTPFFARR